MDRERDGDRPRSEAERRVLDAVAERRGEEWVAAHAELVLAQARLVGEL